MTDTNSELDKLRKRLTALAGYALAAENPNPSSAIDLLVKDINQLLLNARRDEARHWDEHILGAPRKITVNDKAKDRIGELDTQIQEGTE